MKVKLFNKKLWKEYYAVLSVISVDRKSVV